MDRFHVLKEVLILEDILNLIGGISGGNNPIDRTDINGFTVSTVNTSDLGPETAIIGKDGNARPVERYNSIEDAQIGHKKWVKICEEVKDALKITKLGYGNLIKNEDIIVCPKR